MGRGHVEGRDGDGTRLLQRSTLKKALTKICLHLYAHSIRLPFMQTFVFSTYIFALRMHVL